MTIQQARKEKQQFQEKKQLLIDIILDLIKEWIKQKDIADTLWIDKGVLTRIKQDKLSMSLDKVKEYLWKLEN